MDLMTIAQIALIIFLFLVVRFLSWKVKKYEVVFKGVAIKYNTLAIKHNQLIDEYNKQVKG